MSYFYILKLLVPHHSFDLLAQAFVDHSFRIASATELNTKTYH